MSFAKSERKSEVARSQARVDPSTVDGQKSSPTTTRLDWQKEMRKLQRSRRQMIRIVEKYGIHNFAEEEPEYQLGLEARDRLPPLLEDKYGITDVNHYVQWPFGRTTIEMFAFARRGGSDVLIVGSMKMNLEAKHFDQLKRWVKVVGERYGQLNGREIVPLIVVNSAPESELRRAARRGVIIVQSHEWLGYPAE